MKYECFLKLFMRAYETYYRPYRHELVLRERRTAGESFFAWACFGCLRLFV